MLTDDNEEKVKSTSVGGMTCVGSGELKSDSKKDRTPDTATNLAGRVHTPAKFSALRSVGGSCAFSRYVGIPCGAAYLFGGAGVPMGLPMSAYITFRRQKSQLLQILFYQPVIVSRATLCWLGRA